MTSLELATWVTGVGTILVAVVAVAVPYRQRKLDLKDRAEADEKRAKERAADDARRDRERELENWQAERDRRLRDLDDTRRLLMAALHFPDALHSPELFGTLVNALAWHSWMIPPDTVAQLLARYRDDGSSKDSIEFWLIQLSTMHDELTTAEPLTPIATLLMTTGDDGATNAYG